VSLPAFFVFIELNVLLLPLRAFVVHVDQPLMAKVHDKL
jgi:hypothetical protein